ncbi:MAG: AbrB/MazE/SpoVT family DNA-binding domain-containing protein [Planctomycetes bacterium]|nr:AbrB/MazE/SpoVT family DNA-binding domain-containing protein [Planctomycetota bacterium]
MRNPVHVVRLSSKGQIIIPASIRKSFSLRVGQPLVVREREGREIVFIPLEKEALDLDDLLEKARDWVEGAGRDLVEDLHNRRRLEREKEALERERGSH